MGPLRQAFVERGLRAAQEVFLAFVRLAPQTSPATSARSKDKANVSHELAELIHAGKVVKGQGTGQVVPYLLWGPVLPPYTQ